MKFPPWATDESSRLEYLLRSAALHNDREGSLPKLARQCGFTTSGFMSAIHRGSMTPGMAAAVELVVGAETITKEILLCPEKYAS